MIIDLDEQSLTAIKNPVFASYASIYTRIYQSFMDRVRQTGIEIDAHDYTEEVGRKIASLRGKGALLRNDDKSIYINAISPACVACQTGVGSATFFISLQCHRSCAFCFNPNQEDYAYFSHHKRDCVKELRQIHASGQGIKHLALTGGEPLLHKEEAVGFYRFARKRFPDVHTRLYTCGDHVNAQILSELKSAGLDEIRFSIRMHDLNKGQRSVFDRIALAKSYIPSVMVEMPVLPGTSNAMREVLQELDRLDIFGVNLLEFCFPQVNADVFNQNAYRVKSPPYRVMYDYWYAGGLPVAGSEMECLDLLDFALDRRLRIGVHYCSLENKHTGQIYQQNTSQPTPRMCTLSKKDYFLKSAKVFGDDVPEVIELFRKLGCDEYQANAAYGYVEFPVGRITALAGLNPRMEVGVSSGVMETRKEGPCLRELEVALTYPCVFDPDTDV